MTRKSILLVCLSFFFLMSFSQEYISKEDVSYIPKGETDEYRKERCKLDIYYPSDKKDFVTVVWFHGGGLEGGEKGIPAELKNKGIAVVAPNYRLSTKAKNPAYIEDAAEAVAGYLRISLHSAVIPPGISMSQAIRQEDIWH